MGAKLGACTEGKQIQAMKTNPAAGRNANAVIVIGCCGCAALLNIASQIEFIIGGPQAVSGAPSRSKRVNYCMGCRHGQSGAPHPNASLPAKVTWTLLP